MVFQDRDSVGFFLDRIWLVSLGLGFCWFFFGSDSVGFSLDQDSFFSRIGLFRLLIQRCKNVTAGGSLFDKGGDRLDESGVCPTNGFLGWVGRFGWGMEIVRMGYNRRRRGYYPRRQFFLSGPTMLLVFQDLDSNLLDGSDGFALGFSGHRLTSFQWIIGFKRAF